MNIFHLPHGVPVLETMARHLLNSAGDDPTALSRALVFLPTRRAARALGAAFLRVGEGRPMLPPRMAAIGDIDENPLFASLSEGLPPAIAGLERQAVLAGMITAHDATITPDRAFMLAAELGALLDEAHEGEIELAGLDRLAPDRFAAHWQRALGFLVLATGRWRDVLARQGAMDRVARRVAVVHRLAARMACDPPAARVLAVGITAPTPANVALLRAIAAAPHGAVILAGLDTMMSEAAWEAVGPSHPQAELRALLGRLELDRRAVAAMPHAAHEPRPRASLFSRALLPAEALDWRVAPAPEENDRMALLNAPDSATEARAVALAVRQALENANARVAVITPDRALAERVAAALARFKIAVADSAAVPLGRTPPGALLRLVVQAVARNLAPVPLLSLLRHPLVAGGMPPGAFRAAGRNLELAALRGPRPGAAAILTDAALDPRWTENPDRREEVAVIRALQQAVAEALSPLRELLAGGAAAAPVLLRASVTAAETLCATDAVAGASRLWQGPEGAALSRHVSACDAALAALPPIDPRTWPDLLDQLLAQESASVRRTLSGGADAPHPRVEILGVLEARLLHHDVRILAGLNEGTWPKAPETGPWLSREQRSALGLLSPDAQLGFAAADFVAAACACDTLVLTRAQRVEGEPGVASRWITRLLALAGEQRLKPQTDHVALATMLDRGLKRQDDPRPCPRPPLAVRPRALPVTAVETLRRNPYAIHAQRILRLRPLDPLDQEADAADWGDLVHKVAADFFAALARDPATDAEAAFLGHGRRRMRDYNARPGLVALWGPRLATLAPWFAREFAGRGGVRFSAEVNGLHEFPFPSGPFVLTARADLIERDPDGNLALIDFKTGGNVPSGAMVRDGRALQLPLSALIAHQGGFAGHPDGRVMRLAYAKLPGGAEPGRMFPVAADAEVAEAMARAHEILGRLVARYADPDAGYQAMPVADDFAHLARVQGWGETPDAEDDE